MKVIVPIGSDHYYDRVSNLSYSFNAKEINSFPVRYAANCFQGYGQNSRLILSLSLWAARRKKIQFRNLSIYI